MGYLDYSGVYASTMIIRKILHCEWVDNRWGLQNSIDDDDNGGEDSDVDEEDNHNYGKQFLVPSPLRIVGIYSKSKFPKFQETGNYFALSSSTEFWFLPFWLRGKLLLCLCQVSG